MLKEASRLRRKCRTVVIICLLLAASRLADAMIPFFHPIGWSSWRASCVYSLCEWRVDNAALLPPALDASEKERPEVIAFLRRHANARKVRAWLVVTEFVRLVPELLFLLSLALGFRYLGRGEVFGLKTIMWLRRAALAALAFVIVQPLIIVMHMVILLTPLTRVHANHEVTVYVPIGEILFGLFLASSAWVVAFALDAGGRKQDELAEYV